MAESKGFPSGFAGRPAGRVHRRFRRRPSLLSRLHSHSEVQGHHECRHLSRHGFGLGRLCGLGFAASFYVKSAAGHRWRPPAKRRGPKPSISDEALLVAIEADLEASPWEGFDVVRRHPPAALRVMRENNLLSPHRCRRRGGNRHVGEIITHAPNLMWGTDGVRVFTVDDGWGWIFTAIAWNAECVGWQCASEATARRPSADPMGLEAVCLDLRRCGAGAGLADGSRLPVSVGPLHQPDQVLGHPAVLRLRRTAPDQRRRREVQSHAQGTIIHGRIYRNIAELRNAVRGFVEQYNAGIVEKRT